MKTSIVTGATGQTGSWLVEKLLSISCEDHKVVGLTRRSSTPNLSNLKNCIDNPNFSIWEGDLTDLASLAYLVSQTKPDFFFNLAAQSHVGYSFSHPLHSFAVNATGTLNCLEAIRQFSPETRFLQASTSELFGGEIGTAPQNELTNMVPKSPYAISKLAAYHSVINYREAHKIFACNAISYNHESSRRSLDFLPRKVTHAAARIKLGLQNKLLVGDTSTKRDWLDARNVCCGLIQIISADKPDDWVMSSGESRSVQDLIEYVFDKLNLNWEEYVEVDPSLFRPSEVLHLEGDSSKIRKELGWQPTISFDQMICDMIEHDLFLANQELQNL